MKSLLKHIETDKNVYDMLTLVNRDVKGWTSKKQVPWIYSSIKLRTDTVPVAFSADHEIYSVWCVQGSRGSTQVAECCVMIG